MAKKVPRRKKLTRVKGERKAAKNVQASPLASENVDEVGLGYEY